METNVYFVRHGSVQNEKEIIYGRMPGFDLSLQGKQEAEKAASFLTDKGVSAIYTSPLARCFQTAEIIAKKFPGMTPKHIYELIEVEASRWEGSNWEDLVRNVYYEEFVNNPASTKVDENLSALAARMEKITKGLVEAHKGQSLVCVSHEFPILALKLYFENKPFESLKNYSLTPGGITLFVFDSEGNFVKTRSVGF